MKSAFLSAFGIVFQIWKTLVEEVKNLGGSDEDLRKIETDRELRRKIAELIVGERSTVGELIAKVGTTEEQLSNWVRLYREVFSIELDGAEVKIPEQRQGFNRLIVVANGLTLNQIVEGLRKKMKAWLYTEDLDRDVIQAPYIKRPPAPYAVWVRESKEADEELKNRSALDLERDQVNTLTLPERLLYELVFHDETGEHLDHENWTLCAGSRDRGGRVPCVGWRPADGEVGVSWADSGNRGAGIRARLAVA